MTLILRSCIVTLLVFLFFDGIKGEAIADNISSIQPASGLAEKRTLIRAVQFLAPHLNPLVQVGHPIYSVATQLYASPLRFDATGKARPYLAKLWSVSEDGLLVTLDLVENGVFHDGHPVTSQDVVFSLLALRDNHPFTPLYAPIARVETAGRHRVIIHLRHPHPALEVMLGPVFCPVLPKHVYGDGQPLRTHPANAAPVGSGPFRFHARPAPDHLELVRHDGFFRPGLPHLDKIVIHAAGIEGDFPLLLNHGGADLADQLYEGIQGFEELRSNPKIKVSIIGNKEQQAFSILLFNTRRKPLDDVRVRQALAMTIDRRRLVELVSHGRDIHIEGPIQDTSPLFTKADTDFVFDPARANKLLDEAGYLRDEEGKRFSLRLAYLPCDENMQWLADYLRFDAQRLLGIDLVVEHAASIQEWGASTVKGDFDLNVIALFGFRDPLIGIHRLYHSRSIDVNRLFTNHMSYANPQVDELLDRAAQTTELEQRRSLYAEFQRQLLIDMPAYTLGRFDLYTAWNRDLLGIENSSWGSFAPFDELYWCPDREE